MKSAPAVPDSRLNSSSRPQATSPVETSTGVMRGSFQGERVATSYTPIPLPVPIQRDIRAYGSQFINDLISGTTDTDFTQFLNDDVYLIGGR